MKVQAKHGKVTQNMHGTSRNYRYVWDVSPCHSHEGHSSLRYQGQAGSSLRWPVPYSFQEWTRGITNCRRPSPKSTMSSSCRNSVDASRTLSVKWNMI